MGAYWETISGGRDPGIEVKSIDHFNAHGMRRVYGRRDTFPIAGKRAYNRNLDIWLTRESRILARFWAEGTEVDEESFEIVGIADPSLREKQSGVSEGWVPQRLRDEYDDWIVSNS